MKRKLTSHEKILITMLVIAVIGVALSWDRISEQAGKTWKIYTSTNDTELTKTTGNEK